MNEAIHVSCSMWIFEHFKYVLVVAVIDGKPTRVWRMKK